jgi:glycosyltransferase involved in cell wall biosynthesis
MSNTLLEAMAAGVPPIASDVGGNKDVIEDCVNGFLADWEHTTACVDLLITLLSNPVLRQKVGKAASKRASTFAMAEIAHRYQQLYRTILQEGAP